MVADGERRAWDRLPHETPRAYDAFRRFRELGPGRNLRALVEATGAKFQTVRSWSDNHRWYERAVAWDDEVHMLDDRERLDALRRMHETHQKVGRALQAKALDAINLLDPAAIPAYAAARLMELGTRLERDILTVSVDDLLGTSHSDAAVSDPWEAIARELTGGTGD